MSVTLKNYKKELDYSYTLGTSPTLELLNALPEQAMHLFASPSFMDSPVFRQLEKYAARIGIPFETNDKMIRRLSPKENVFVVGVFRKYTAALDPNGAHIVLVNPSDMGNVGTIMRTSLGFGIKNIAVIRPGVDLFHPRTVRSSMGAIFKTNCEYFDSFPNYMRQFPRHDIFTFMTKGTTVLQDYGYSGEQYALVFGNEATGLDDEFLSYGTSLRIGHEHDIDSLNLSNAVSISIYAFTKQKYCGTIMGS